jgi:uncharacterized protein HemY
LRERHAELLRQIALTEGDPSSLLGQLPALTQAAQLSDRKTRRLNETTLRAIAHRALEDELLTVEEADAYPRRWRDSARTAPPGEFGTPRPLSVQQKKSRAGSRQMPQTRKR